MSEAAVLIGFGVGFILLIATIATAWRVDTLLAREIAVHKAETDRMNRSLLDIMNAHANRIAAMENGAKR